MRISFISHLFMNTALMLLVSGCSTGGSEQTVSTNNSEPGYSMESLKSDQSNDNTLEKNDESLTEIITTESTTVSEWNDAYRVLLKTFFEENENNSMAFFDLVDLNQDGTPELLFSDNNSHAGGVDIYTFKEHQVTLLGHTGMYGELRYSKDYNLVLYDDTHTGCTIVNIVSLDNNEWNELLYAENNESSFIDDETELDKSKVSYILNHQDVDHDTYYAALAEYGLIEDDYERASYAYYGQTYHLDQETIDSVLPEN